MKKKIMQFKYWKYVWIVGLFASLLLILYLVVQYKVKYEDRVFDSFNKIKENSIAIKL